MAARRYWLVKTEPESFSIQDLAAAPRQTTHWDGVRNYQARNMMRDEMRKGDRVLIYHSNANPPAVVGVGVIVREAYPDPSAQDSRSLYYDPQASQDNPRWVMVDLQLEQIFEHPLALDQLRQMESLQGMELLRKGSRLSVQPVSSAHFQAILRRAARGK